MNRFNKIIAIILATSITAPAVFGSALDSSHTRGIFSHRGMSAPEVGAGQAVFRSLSNGNRWATINTYVPNAVAQAPVVVTAPEVVATIQATVADMAPEVVSTVPAVVSTVEAMVPAVSTLVGNATPETIVQTVQASKLGGLKDTAVATLVGLYDYAKENPKLSIGLAVATAAAIPATYYVIKNRKAIGKSIDDAYRYGRRRVSEKQNTAIGLTLATGIAVQAKTDVFSKSLNGVQLVASKANQLTGASELVNKALAQLPAQETIVAGIKNFGIGAAKFAQEQGKSAYGLVSSHKYITAGVVAGAVTAYGIKRAYDYYVAVAREIGADRLKGQLEAEEAARVEEMATPPTVEKVVTLS